MLGMSNAFGGGVVTPVSLELVNGTVGRVSSDWWLSLGLTTDRSPLRS